VRQGIDRLDQQSPPDDPHERRFQGPVEVLQRQQQQPVGAQINQSRLEGEGRLGRQVLLSSP
jgi:hypothetical protein